ncbi:hypothetical protein TURU_008801 [Turdus rufiventris]|nr:hypothetical protein TURU_008801 [Turdus rufiventris]
MDKTVGKEAVLLQPNTEQIFSLQAMEDPAAGQHALKEAAAHGDLTPLSWLQAGIVACGVEHKVQQVYPEGLQAHGKDPCLRVHEGDWSRGRKEQQRELQSLFPISLSHSGQGGHIGVRNGGVKLILE